LSPTNDSWQGASIAQLDLKAFSRGRRIFEDRRMITSEESSPPSLEPKAGTAYWRGDFSLRLVSAFLGDLDPSLNGVLQFVEALYRSETARTFGHLSRLLGELASTVDRLNGPAALIVADVLNPWRQMILVPSWYDALSLNPFVLAKHETSSEMRPDQLVSLRYWGIGFRFRERHDEEQYKHAVLRGVLNDLASRLPSLIRSLSRLRLIAYDNDGDDAGKKFERLIRDVLNETTRVARFAPVDEDLFEKTDLRVSYPELNRRHGARIQVALGATPRAFKEKFEGVKRLEEIVVVSPLTLAACVQARARMGQPVPSGFWSVFHSKPADVDELAMTLRKMFVGAIRNANTSPLGPSQMLPSSVRHLIQEFVHGEACRSTAVLREREQTK
jgi:hypothetical protein